jgi:molybdopterin synthase catalytic subunit
MIELTENSIEVGTAFERVFRKGAGSVVIHVGVVKPFADGRRTKGIRLVPEENAAEEMRTVEDRLRRKWKVEDVLLIRRVGELRVGEVILVAAVSATSKDAAFGACEEAVESLKEKRGLSKEELYEGD